MVLAEARRDLKIQKLYVTEVFNEEPRKDRPAVRLAELTVTSPVSADRLKVNWSCVSVSMQPLMWVASEQTNGVAHSNK